MTSTIKVLVSRKKKRYRQDGFNLDLTYIYDNIIAMGYPAEHLEGVYRNHIDDVVRFLESKHKNHYKIYNLCSERSYNIKRFQDRVATFPFDDHNPPKLELIKHFCEDVDKWLAEDPENVAAVHCKAGKGRTGVMICCYILHRGWYDTADEALSHYGQTRTHNRKGVTIPSQRRYVNYYDQLLKSRKEYSPKTVLLHEVYLDPVPNYSGGCVPILTILEAGSQTEISPTVDLKKENGRIRLVLNPPLTLKGDIRIDFKNKPNVVMLKEKMFHFWFNTFFVKDELPLNRSPVLHSKANPANGSGPKTVKLPVATNRVGGSLTLASRVTLTPNHLLPSNSRASSLSSLTTDGLSDSSLHPTRWYSLTLTKQELDRACKDTSHRIFPADFKVTLCFTRPIINGAGSLPNVDSAGLCSNEVLPSILTNVQSAPAISCQPANGNVAKEGAHREALDKPNSPLSRGLVGPICWRNTRNEKQDRVNEEYDYEEEEEQMAVEEQRYRLSDSSQWSSEDNYSSDVDQAERSRVIPDHEGDPCSSECLPVGRYRLLSYSSCTSGHFRNRLPDDTQPSIGFPPD